MPEAITFTVRGMKPASQGSKVLFRGRMVESCKDLPRWRSLITRTAEALGVGVIPGPVSLSVTFMMPRPAGHWTKTGKLSSKATPWPSVKPDADKLLRAVGDALTGVLIEDDARVVNITGSKRWCRAGEEPGALITIIGL